MSFIRLPVLSRTMWIAFLLLSTEAICPAAEPADAPQVGAAPAPVVLPIRELNLFRDLGSLPEQNVGAVAVGPGERRLYVGVRSSGRSDLRNLAVFSLDAAGTVVGGPRRYQVGDEPLAPGFDASLNAMLVDAARRKLYLASSRSGPTPDNAARMLTVYDLDADGEPTGRPRHYETGNPHKGVLSIARHPRSNVLYMVGFGGPGVYSYRLDAAGEPAGRPEAFAAGGYGKYEVAASADGERLYLGTYPDRVEIVDLDENGMPAGKPRSFDAGQPAGSSPDYLRFAYAPRALYLRRETADGARLAVWPLDGKGDPVGTPQQQEGFSLSALAVDAERNRLWGAVDSTFEDAFTGKTTVRGVIPTAFPLAENGIPETPGRGHPIRHRPHPFPLQTGAVVGVSPAGRPVFLTRSLTDGVLGNRVKGYHARVTILKLSLRNGQEPATVPAVLQTGGLGAAPAKLGDLAMGQPSRWVNLDPHLKDQRGPVVAHVVVSRPVLDFSPFTTPEAPAHLRVRLDVADGDPAAGGKVLKTLTETVQGEHAAFLLPGYAFEPSEDRLAAIGTLSGHAERYLATARRVGIKPGERPRLFPISCYHLLGGQGHPGQLKASAETVSLLGFNVVNAYWWGAIPPEQIDATLDGHGLQRRMMAAYNPPSYFDFDRDKMNPQALDKWAASSLGNIGPMNGGTPKDVVWHVLSDEPGWYYPGILREVRENPTRLEAFRGYLRGKGFQPADLGAAGWDAVFPIGASGAKDLPTRRLYYWTMRFFPEAASRGHKLAREALERAAGHRLLTPVNWNAIPWHIPSPNQQIGYNQVVDPDTAEGRFDWFDSGRVGAHTLWTEDWFPDQQAQTWSMYSDMLRSASMLGDQTWGSYVIGPTTGRHPAGASYKILSLIGHGAKAVDFYTWGPELLTPAGAWSERLEVYGPVADALRLVGRGERLLYPGRPERGRVALFFPGASALWDQDMRMRHYYHETWSLHYALTHAGYTVDFVDEKDLAGDALATRGYTTLYLTGPNVPVKAQEQVGAWVEAGGTLVVTPGGAAADEYNTPVGTLDAVLGLKPRTAVRDPAANEHDWEGLQPAGTLAQMDPRFGAGEVHVYGPVAALETDGAATVAKLKSGGAAIAENVHGKGRAISYGFFPGWQYWLTPERVDTKRLPLRWGAAQRRLATAPARIADTPRPVVVSQEGVEACRLQSDGGIAIVLLNWTDEPVASLRVSVPRAGGFRTVTSLQRGAVKSSGEGDTVEATLPLGGVDVLLIE